MLQRKTHPFVARPFRTSSGWAVQRREEETLPTHRGPLALLLLAAALAGCTSSTAGPSPTPTAVVSSASPSPTLSEGQRAANDVVVKYRALIDELRQQYKPDVSALLAVAGKDAYEKWRYTLQDDFASGVHQTGTSSVSTLRTEAGSSSGQWIVAACVDFTKVDIVNKDGQSVMTAPGARQQVTYTVDQDSTTLAWYVANEEGGSQC